jgi:hypothetical protein
LRYAATALATLAAGPLLEHYGWSALNLAILPLLLICATVSIWWMLANAADAKNAAAKTATAS